MDQSRSFEIGFEARVAERADEGVEDVGDGAGDRIGLGQRPRVGLVLEGTVAVELEFGEDVIGREMTCARARSRGRRGRLPW